MTPLLELRHVVKTFRSGLLRRRAGVTALDDVSLSLSAEHPTITAIAGESGSGKTTLAHLLLGHVLPTSGSVLYRGRDVTTLSRDERFEFRRHVQPIFQDPFAAFNPFYRVDHVLRVPIQRYHLASGQQAATALIETALERVGLRPAETLGRFPHQLSGGQRQRLMVARALLCQPRIILADEPVSMVDASLRATILASLRRLTDDFGISIVYITHDLTTAYQISENIVILYQGQAVEVGAVEDVIRNPKHPYTQLLIAAIPLVDRRRRWQADTATDVETAADRPTVGCRFAPRCPMAMDVCWRQRPTLTRPDPHRAVACFLHAAATPVSDADISAIFAHPAAAVAALPPGEPPAPAR